MPAQIPPRRPSASNCGPTADRSARDAWPGEQMRLMEDDLRSWRQDRYRQQPVGGASMTRPTATDGRGEAVKAE